MRHRGYALYTALVLVGLAGVVFAATMSLLKTDLARTNAELTQTQLRQLLLAGEASAYTELSQTARLTSRRIPVPPDLSDATLVLQVTQSTPDQATAKVLATYLDASREQSLTYTRQDGSWRLTAAKLP